MLVEGFHGNRGLVPPSPSVRLASSPCPPRGARPGWRGSEGGEVGGGGARTLRGPGHLQEGREAVREGRGVGATSNGGDGDHLGVDHRAGPGAAGAPAGRAGRLCGDGGDQRLLEAVLLPARGRRVRTAAGQRPAREEPAGPQDRRRGCDLAGAAGRARAGTGLVRATGADPGVAGPDPGPHRYHPGTLPGDPAAREAARGRRHQAVRGGQRHPRGVRAGDAGGPGRRAA